MDAPTELLVRTKELVRSLCARNLIPGAHLNLVTVAIHDEMVSSSLATLAEVALRCNSTCRGNMDVAIKSAGYELVQHCLKREKERKDALDEDPVTRAKSVPLVPMRERPDYFEPIYGDPDV
jgi:hypothetical protein